MIKILDRLIGRCKFILIDLRQHNDIHTLVGDHRQRRNIPGFGCFIGIYDLVLICFRQEEDDRTWFLKDGRQTLWILVDFRRLLNRSKSRQIYVCIQPLEALESPFVVHR